MLAPSTGRGVGCLAGRDDLSLLAWSDLGPDPAVHVYQYAAPAEVKNMDGKKRNSRRPINLTLLLMSLLLGDASSEYLSLALNQKGLLLGLSGVPDYRLTLWNWENEERICTVDTGLTVRE